MIAIFAFAFLGLGPLSPSKWVEIRGEKFQVEVAETPKEWMKGLMFRDRLGRREGMLFWGTQEKIQSFWMKNTPLSLDIIFIDRNLKIINIIHRATPLSLESRSSTKPALHVLEILGGEASALKLRPGDSIKIFAQ